MIKLVEYIWLDGNPEVPQIRSKARTVFFPNSLENSDSLERNMPQAKDFPMWSFDGSSTNQASGSDSDCLLDPVCVVKNPLSVGDYLVLCEVRDGHGNSHASNSRAKLRDILVAGGDSYDVWLGFEQEYTLFKRNIPLGWPEHGFPAPQGPYYCGVGTEQIFGRDLAVEHAKACIDAGLMYYGMNAEVMPGQWEFQIGYRGGTEEKSDPLTISDHLWIARWLLHRLSENYGVHVSVENKPIKGDWNGAGMHTNFSTKQMRDPECGKKIIEEALEKLEIKHWDHIKVYGHKLEERLTGLHETSRIDEFSIGGSGRGGSIRIPKIVEIQGCGYIEDRRPGANADPYKVASKLISTMCM